MVWNRLLFAALLVPLGSGENWEDLKFNSIAKNKAEFTSSGLKLKVRESSSPLVFQLNNKINVRQVEVKGTVSSLVQLPEGAIQGEKKYDDYVLKVCLVYEGKQTLNWLQRQAAAEWVVRLFSLAPKGVGIDHLYCLAAGQDPKLQGRERTHPLSDYIKEKVAWTIQKPGPFDWKIELPPKPVRAVWLSPDGDNTKSSFDLELSKIKLIE